MLTHDERLMLFGVTGLFLSAEDEDTLAAIGDGVKADMLLHPAGYTETVKAALREVYALNRERIRRGEKWRRIESVWGSLSAIETTDEDTTGPAPAATRHDFGRPLPPIPCHGKTCSGLSHSGSSASSGPDSDVGTPTLF